MTIPGYSMTTAAQFVGCEMGTSDWVSVDQQRIDWFAQCTGDHQWIHVDVDRAKRESPFGGPIAHGYLTLSLVAPMVMELGVIPPDAASGLASSRRSRRDHAFAIARACCRLRHKTGPECFSSCNARWRSRANRSPL